MRLSPTGLMIFVISVGSLIVIGPDINTDVDAVASSDFGRSLTAAAELTLVAISCWMVLCVALAAAAAQAVWLARVAHAVTPALLRRAMFMGAAGALVIGPVSAANNAAQGPADTTTGTSLDGLRLPDRPSTPALTESRLAASEPLAPIVVRPGDSLWSMAARGLGGDATISQINTATHQWYAANRAQIGSNPNLIFPGQELVPPTKDSP